MSETKKVCVIGAGLSGLTAIKELRELNHEVTCFEKGSSIGGVFAAMKAYDSVLLTVSNYFMAYSDFMPTEERVRYWTKDEYHNYLLRYVEHFGLMSSIQLDSTVTGLQREGDKWLVTVMQGGEQVTHEFDAVAMCSGQFQKVRIPEIEGLDQFKGERMHSHDYKNAEPFAGKRVLCIGLGESSADITTEISEVAAKTTLSLRRLPLVAQRYFAVIDNDSYNTLYPLDAFTTIRSYNYLPRDIHTKFTQLQFKRFINSYDPGTSLRGTWNKAAGAECSQVIMKNERVFDSIVDGRVDVNSAGIERLTEDEVVFRDGTREKIDAIMFCTGFSFDVPLLDLNVEDPRDLYKNMFHPKLGDSIALIGFVRPQQGGVPALAELQSRYFALVCSGERTLPAPEEMEQGIAQDKQRWLDEYSLTPQVSGLVNFVHFAEDIARCVGCELQVDRKKDKALYEKCLRGPLWAIQYRLRGPGARPELARKILLEKAPVAFKPPLVAAVIIDCLVWLRKLLPVGPDQKPRFI